jgi:beta-lactamase regulating signal transducer with metallopeptidase domain
LVDLLLHVGLSNAVLATGLALLAAGTTLLRFRPALVHSLWLLVLLKLLTPPLVHVPLPRIELPDLAEAAAPAVEAETPVPLTLELTPVSREAEPLPAAPFSQPFAAESAALPEATIVEASPAPARDIAMSWQFVIIGAWLIGSVAWFGVALIRVHRFERLLRLAEPAPESLRAELRDLAEQLGLRRCPSVGLVPGAVAPMLWAAGGTPRLLLPRGLLGRLGRLERQTLLAHELAHLRRRDHWVRGLEFIATGLFWWHPVVWWARRELREAEEQCCDAWVVWALPSAARAYATALVETVDFLSEARPVLPPTASGFGQVRLLKRRLTMIMQGRTPRALSPVGTFSVLALAGMLLPLLPTWSQAEPPSEPSQPVRQLQDILRSKDLDKETRENLEKALKALQEKEKEKQSQREGEIKRAKEEAEKASADLKRLQAELQKAAERHAMAHQRLAELSGEVWRQDNVRFIIRNAVPAAAWKVETLPGLLQNQKYEIVGPQASEERLRSVEKKLTDLLKEVEKLRKDMEKPKEKGTPKSSAQPADPFRKIEVTVPVAPPAPAPAPPLAR